MQAKVNGSEPFKCMKETFCIGTTTSGYTLAYSATKEGTYTAYTQATPANECLIVNGVTPYMWFKLSGNTDNNVEVIL